MQMLINTVRDHDTGVTTVSLEGALTIATLTGIRSTVLKIASECPTAVIVDLNGLVHGRRSLLSVFANVTRRAMADYGVPVLLCAASDEIAHGLSPFRSIAPAYRDRGAAVTAALHGTAPRWVHARMMPTPVGVSLARNTVAEACLTWGLSHLLQPARRIVSELAANAAEHAASPFDVTVAHTPVYLRIAVEDRSLNQPWPLPDLAPDPHQPLADRGRRHRPVREAVRRRCGSGAPPGGARRRRPS